MKKAAPVEFTSYDAYLFGHATHYDIYKKLGAHPTERDEANTSLGMGWKPSLYQTGIPARFMTRVMVLARSRWEIHSMAPPFLKRTRTERTGAG